VSKAADPGRESPQEKLRRVARQLRERAEERRKKGDLERIELTWADGRIVHAPTRAEAILAFLRAGVLAPLLIPAGAFAFRHASTAVLGNFARQLDAFGPLMFVTAILMTILLAKLAPALKPRDMSLARLRVFERGSMEPYILLSLTGGVLFFVIAVMIVHAAR
jgi:hypothetical protein